MSISDQLRQAISESGKSANVLAKETGVPQPTITRFLNGAEMRTGSIDKLSAYLGLTLTKEPASKPAAKRGKK